MARFSVLPGTYRPSGLSRRMTCGKDAMISAVPSVEASSQDMISKSLKSCDSNAFNVSDMNAESLWERMTMLTFGMAPYLGGRKKAVI